MSGAPSRLAIELLRPDGESRAALRVAVAWGYVEARDVEAGERMLDSV